MRLSAADEVKKAFIVNRYGTKAIEYVIDDAPTVKAIPVERIEKRLQRALAFTHSKAEGNIIDDGCVVEVVSASFTANVLVNLLEDWEKENENRKVEEKK